MNTSKPYNLIGFGVCGANEQYLDQTLDEFERLCDHTVIVGNSIDKESEAEILSRGFTLWKDDREWGTSQHLIKRDAVVRLSEFNPDWVLTLDMDERFDSTFTRDEADKLMARGGYGYFFYIVNLYEHGYTKDWSFWNNRMFRYDKSLNFANKPLHCGLAPELHWRYSNYAPFLLLHYGLKDKASRDRKVERYAKYDPEAKNIGRSYYDFLASKARVDELNVSKLHEEVKKEVATYHFKEDIPQQLMAEKQYFYVKNPAGVILDIPDYQLEETLARPGFSLVSDTPIQLRKDPIQSTETEAPMPVVPEENPLECDVCGFVAKNKTGLKVHSKKHD